MTAAVRLLAPLLLALGACGELPADGAGEGVRHAVIGGEPSPSSEDGVLILRADPDTPEERLCSSSLVAPNLLLTARHCVSYLTEAPFRCSLRGEAIDNEEGGGYLGAHVAARAIEVYGAEQPRDAPLARGQRVLSTRSSTICVDDLAFVVLDRSLDLPVLPLRLGRPARIGEAAVLVGYGVKEDAEQLSYRVQLRHRRTGLAIADVGPDDVSDVTTFPPRSLLLVGPSGCVGDSGGPLVLEDTGAVVGVYSLLADSACTDAEVRHHFVHVPAYQALIDEAFAAAEAEPTVEPTDGAAGGTGAGGARDTPIVEPDPPRRDDGSCRVARAAVVSRDSGALLTLVLAALGRYRRRRNARGPDGSVNADHRADPS